jgi:hypothetical protein
MNKKLALKTVVLLSTLTSFSSALCFAQDQSSGCGLGWEVSQKQSLLSSAVRLTTDTVLPNTFSMTFGTSGCAKHEIVKNDEKAVEYAVNNYDSLVVEMAQGGGEFTEGFAQALGCDAAQAPAFEALMQTRYSDLSKQSGGDGIGLYRAVRTEIQANPSLASQCVPHSA